jgi:hypothetical protein
MAVLGGILICAAVLIVSIAVRAKSNAKKQNGWDRVSGKIISSEVRLSAGYFDPVIKYEYTYVGRTYRSERVRSLEISVNWSLPGKGTVARFPADSEVTVYVNPQDPTYSVLEPGGDAKFLPLMVLISAALLFIGVCSIACN